MAPAKTAPKRRTRKRKRRAASTSSSSSSSSSDSDSNEESTVSPPKKAAVLATSDSESDSSSSSSSDDESEAPGQIEPKSKLADKRSTPAPRKYSPSPSPPPTEIPPFLPPVTSAERGVKEEAMKLQFRKFWLTAVADGFKDDLEEIRKEPNLNTSRLALLIDSLASGADVFTSQKDGGADDIQTLLG